MGFDCSLNTRITEVCFAVYFAKQQGKKYLPFIGIHTCDLCFNGKLKIVDALSKLVIG